MQRKTVIAAMSIAVFLGVVIASSYAEDYRYNGMMSADYGYGMMGGGYGMGPGMMGGGWVDVPEKLPTPKNQEWIKKFTNIFMTEKESLAQYAADQGEFNAYMPYMMIIPQEEDHVRWIGDMLKAYGLKPEEKSYKVQQSKSLADAYKLGIKLESELLPEYEWLIKNAEDQDSAGILNTILLQSRWHLAMFDHASRIGTGYGYGMMGRGHGYGMGPGMMGRGGYGMGYGSRGYNGLDLMRSELNLKADQAKQIYDLAGQYRSKYFESRGDVDALNKLEKQHRNDIEKILTSEQKKIFGKYKRGFDRYNWYGGCPYHN